MKVDIIILISMFISSYLWGEGILNGFKYIAKIPGNFSEKPARNMVFQMITGLMGLTVFAEIFSLFSGVGAVAFALVVVIDLTVIAVRRKKLFDSLIYADLGVSQTPKLDYILGGGIGAALAVLIFIPTIISPMQYDTYLYHAQAIHWIEEYGVVKGLGNLHNRFAYNSSFLCLQALFSFKWLSGVSHHCANGFIVWLLSFYSIAGMKVWRQRKFFASDLVRFVWLIYITGAENIYIISSSGTDLFPMGILIFILAEWISLVEEDVKEPLRYVLLSILAVFAVSLKLSVATLVLLAIYPAVILIRGKNIRAIIVAVICGIIVIAPFLFRNIIISGYLVYPYPEIDLLNVDWKMPAFMALFDRYEIGAWSRGLKDVMRWNASFSEYFPIWKESLGNIKSVLLYVNLICYPYMLVMGTKDIVRRKNWQFLHLTLSVLAGFALWFFFAPDPRYGGVFLWLMPSISLGKLLMEGSKLLLKESKPLSKEFYRHFPNWPGYLLCAVYSAIFVILFIPVLSFDRYHFAALSEDHDYMLKDCESVSYYGEMIYFPVDSDLSGYDPFPAVPYRDCVEKTELRGEDFRSGFRMKEEYRDSCLSAYGYVFEENIFDE